MAARDALTSRCPQLGNFRTSGIESESAGTPKQLGSFDDIAPDPTGEGDGAPVSFALHALGVVGRQNLRDPCFGRFRMNKFRKLLRAGQDIGQVTECVRSDRDDEQPLLAKDVAATPVTEVCRSPPRLGQVIRFGAPDWVGNPAATGLVPNSQFAP